MTKNKFDLIHKQAKESAIRKVKRELEKQRNYLALKKLDLIMKNGEI